VSVLQPTPDPQLTLITCYPTYYIGPAPRRLVVLSKLVE
jgi:sortase A